MIFVAFKVEVKQSVKFTLFSKVISTLIKKNITNTINVTILKKKGYFVIASFFTALTTQMISHDIVFSDSFYNCSALKNPFHTSKASHLNELSCELLDLLN